MALDLLPPAWILSEQVWGRLTERPPPSGFDIFPRRRSRPPVGTVPLALGPIRVPGGSSRGGNYSSLLPEHALTPTPPASCESSAPLCSGQMCPWGGSGEVTTSGGGVVCLLGRLPAGRPAKLLHCWMFQEGHEPLLLVVSTCVIIELWFCFFGVGEKVRTMSLQKIWSVFYFIVMVFLSSLES